MNSCLFSYRRASRIAVLFVVTCVVSITCESARAKGRAQIPTALVNTSQAKEFYITFPTNIFEAGIPSNVLDLTCFIASNFNAKGTIQLLGANNRVVWQQNFTVDSQSVKQIGIPHQYNTQAEIQDAEDEKAVTKAIHITTDQPVVVYGLSHRPYTADGYLAIPPSSWGTDYRIGGYYGVSSTSESALTTLDVTSELAVVAAYDSTLVEITLTAPTRDLSNNMTHRAGDIVSVFLNKGQVYQMQSYSDPSETNFYDLSMTEVQSSKPVGVFGGSKCADVPISFVACDYVLEMMPPTQSWGKEFFTYQFDPDRRGGDLWRVYPLQDNTVVTINGSAKQTISPSDPVPYYETDDIRDSAELKAPAHWTFNKPVMMVQYITSENYDGSDNNPNVNPPRGDPSSVVLETREQFQTNIIYATPPDSNGYVAPDGIQYINVFIDGGASGTMQDSLYVDGNLVKHLPPLPYDLKFQGQVPGTTFWVFHIEVPGGVHHLSAKTPFSAYAVGFKKYESYAWACALSLKLIGTHDTNAPVLPGTLTCGTLVDTLTDLPNVDSVRSNLAQAGDDSNGIGWVYKGPSPDTTYNFNDTVLPKTFVPGDSSTVVHIQVLNLRNKAHGALYAIDRAGNDTTFYYDYIPDSVTVAPYFLDFGQVASNTAKTDTIVIQNPLLQNVTVDSIWLTGIGTFTIVGGGAPFPFTLTPGQKRNLIIKFFTTNDSGFVSDTVKIKFNCFSRTLAVLGAGSGKPCVSVNGLDYGTLTIASGSAQANMTTEIYNTGTDTLTITGLKIGGGAGSAFSIISPTTPLSAPIKILPGDSLAVQIQFAITAVGNYTDSLIISSDASKTCADSVGILTGSGQQPGPNIGGYNWGPQRVACSATHASGFTVKNSGSSADVLNNLKVISGDAGDFSFSTAQLPLTMPAQSTQFISATFTPANAGYRYLIVEADFGSGKVITDTMLRGTGTYPVISSQNVDFGLQSIGQSKDSFAVALNVPKAYFDELTIDSVAIGGLNPGDFTFIDMNSPKVLADTGDTMHVQIAFSPLGTNLRQATLTFYHDGSFNTCKTDTTYVIQLTGTGQTPGLLIGDWDAGRVFITTTRDTTISDSNSGAAAAVVDSMWLSQNTVFHFGANVTTKNINIAAGSSSPVPITFTPQDTLAEYYDTLNVANNTQTPLVKGFVQGRGKVVIYTAVVPGNISGYPGQNVRIPINVPMGYTRPSAIDPGDPTPLDSGSINDLKMGLGFNPRVILPLAADNTIFDLGGTLATGYTATRTASTNDSVVFELAGAGTLKDSGTVVWTNFRTLYSNVVTMPIYDTVSTAVPYVIWKLVPGLFTVDSVCGLGPSSPVIYKGTAALGQSVPNPIQIADGQTVAIIPFTLTEQTDVQLNIYNSLGQQVANVLSGNLPKGLYNARFDAGNLPAGLYYYRLVTGAAAQTRTMMLMR